MPYIPRPYASDELDALWDRWYRHPDPDVARLTHDEIDRLFETIWDMEGAYTPATPTPPPPHAPEEMP